jgi:hypothetical protein
VSAASRRLTEAHRLAQARIGAETVRIVAATWPLIDVADVKSSAPGWLNVVRPAVQAQRAKSARLAASYLAAHRSLEIGEPFTPLVSESAPERQVTTALLVTGVYHLLSNLGRGLAVERASRLAQAASTGAAMRIALNGGRDTLLDTIRSDPRARGYERVTSGNACDFCSMLADRGAVYGEASAEFEAHDHCSCSAQPVYA